MVTRPFRSEQARTSTARPASRSWVTTADEVGDPRNLALTTRVSGGLRQSNTTANMLFDVASLISFVSRLLTLHPGAVLATGTPGGTGWGQDPELGGTGVTPPKAVEPGRYLRAGRQGGERSRARGQADIRGRGVGTVAAPGCARCGLATGAPNGVRALARRQQRPRGHPLTACSGRKAPRSPWLPDRPRMV